MINSLKHIAFIMDGNGRWAQKQNKLRIHGHSQGAKVISQIIEGCMKRNIKYISFFAFGIENWNRPKAEVDFLMKLLESNLTEKSSDWFNERNIKLNVIGLKENINPNLFKKIENIQNELKNNSEYVVNIFFNYSGQSDIVQACHKLVISKLEITAKNLQKMLLTCDIPNVDLLIRTSGEKRISNFMLWQIAYSEIIFEKTLWPDYNCEILNRNILDYENRDRRFGKVKND